jgi:hypothetical protein
MNDNPEGTPNPLNPGVGAGLGFTETEPSAPETPAGPEAPAEPEAPVAPEPATIEKVGISEEDLAFKKEPLDDPMMRPVSKNNFDTLGMEEKVEVNIKPVAIESTPEPELVAKDSIVEPSKKNTKKKFFIVAAIVLIITAVICGAAAIAIMLVNNNNDDRVNKAIEKLVNGKMPSIVSAQGRISALSNAENATIGSFDIDFNGNFDLSNATNTVSAKINAELSSGDKISIGVDELRDKDGETFFKIRGLDSISNNPLASAYSGVIEAIDDEWILITNDFGDSMGNLGIFENSSTCLINAISTLPQYSSDITKKYEANQFITYSTDKLEISKKKNPLYKLSFNSDKLTAFINSLSNNGFINELNACSENTATNSNVTVEAIEKIFDTFPTVYVEIDDNYNFTRVYFKTSVGDSTNSTSVTADLALSYPAKVELETPDEYINMSTLVNNLVTGVLYSGNTGLTEIEVDY